MRRIAALAFLLGFATGGLQAGTILVTDPRADTTWYPNHPHVIQWIYSGIADPAEQHVRISLRRGDTLACEVAVEVPLDARIFRWHTSACYGLEPGAYRIRVRIPGGNFGDSAEFNIRRPEIVIYEPDFGGTWNIGGTYRISWASSGVTEPLRISLGRFDELPDLSILENQPLQGHVLWTVATLADGSPVPLGTEFQVRIETMSQLGPFATSRGRLRIGARMTAPPA